MTSPYEPDEEPIFVPRRPERLILSRRALIALAMGVVGLLVGGGLLVAGRIRRGQEVGGEDTLLETVVENVPALPAPPVVPGIAGYQVWRGSERVTVLVMGVDERSAETGPWRTDTMIVLSLDPVTRTGVMLSIPRDLWVDIPGEGLDRINTANIHGEQNGYPGGGPGLAMATIEQNIGIPIDHYVMLNFAAFESFVDAIGCISLDVPESISDPTYPDGNYGYDPFYISAGHYDTVCGEQALKYARTRATFGGDFDRAARQQQVIYAVRDKLLQAGNLPALLGQAPAIWESVQDGMETDMTLDEMIGLGLLAKDILDENIRSEVLDGRYTDPAVTGDELHRQVLIPDQTAINLLVRDMFPTPSLGPSLEELAALAAQEGASVSVLNATPNEGLAELVGEVLTDKGLSVQQAAEAGRVDYAETIIYDNGGKPETALYLAELLGVAGSAIVETGDALAEYDVQVVLGADVLSG